MNSMSQKVYIEKLDIIINKYKNICHRTIKTKSIDLKSIRCIYFIKESNKKDPKLEVDDHVRISKYQYFFKNLHFKLI